MAARNRPDRDTNGKQLAAGRASTVHLRSGRERTLVLRIFEPVDAATGIAAMQAFVEGMAELATQLILEGALEASGGTSEDDGIVGEPESLRP